MKVVVLIVTLLSFSQVYGEARYRIIGWGVIDCGEFLDYQTSEEIRDVIDTWVVGYISGMNRVMADAGREDKSLTGEGRSIPAIRRTVVNYCGENPFSTLEDAIYKLYYFNQL